MIVALMITIVALLLVIIVLLAVIAKAKVDEVYPKQWVTDMKFDGYTRP